MARRIVITGTSAPLRSVRARKLSRSWARSTVRGARTVRGGNAVQVRFSQPGRLAEVVREKGVRTRRAIAAGTTQVRWLRGRMIATRTNAAGRPIVPVVRNNLWFRNPGYPTIFRRPPLRVVQSTAAAGTATTRVEGAGGANDPSKKAYRNSARYRERHGLAV